MAKPTPRAGIMDIRPYKPGSSKAQGAENPAKLSSNENPLGASPKAVEAYKQAADSLHLYPDGAWTELREAIAQRYDLDPARIVCGAGSDEILQMLGKAYLNPSDAVVQSEYGFLVYRLVAKQSLAECISAPERNCTADVDAMLAAVTEATKIVFLANPNNPTGTYLPASEVRRLHAGLPEHVLFVVDEAYAEYLREPDYETALPMTDEFDNVVVTRTFSKIYGLAALRLGWAYGPAHVMDALNRVRGPFNVSVPAQKAGAAAIGDREFEQRSIEHNARWRPWLEAEIASLGLKVTPSVGNFVLIHFEEEGALTADKANAFLQSQGLILRPLQPYSLPHALRLTVGTEDENRRVPAALQEFVSGA
ncbi:MAG TPA: histidinol-phosphate transaminase [Paracoccaceae bacterium]|nr:histidinol-phosphate transaminase [Paracoccaceae bacterium]